MRSLDDDELEAMFESDDDDKIFESYDDDESDDDDERFSEARRRSPRSGVPPAVRVGRFQRPPRRDFNLKGQQQGTIQTASGQANVNLGKSLATTAEVKAVADRLSTDIAKTAQGVARLEETVRKIEKLNRAAATREAEALARFEKKVDDRIKATQQGTGMNALLPLLLTPKPQLESVTFTTAPAAGVATTVKESKFKSDSTSDLLPFLLLGGTGSGGGTGGDLFSNPLMALLLIKGLG